MHTMLILFHLKPIYNIHSIDNTIEQSFRYMQNYGFSKVHYYLEFMLIRSRVCVCVCVCVEIKYDQLFYIQICVNSYVIQ